MAIKLFCRIHHRISVYGMAIVIVSVNRQFQIAGNLHSKTMLDFCQRS